MDRFLDWLASLPKTVILLLAFLFVGVLGSLVYFLVLAPEKSEVVESPQQILLEVPSATLADDESSQLEAYRRDRLNSVVTASDFWDKLGEEEASVGGLLVGSEGQSESVSSSHSGRDEFLDPEVYSPTEIYYIRNGTMTKAEVDADHERREEARQTEARQAAEREAAARRQAAADDSLYFARMEKAYEMAMKYSGASSEQQPAEPEEPGTGKPRTIEVEKERSFIPERALAAGGLITSLEQEKVGVTYSDGEINITPVRATFLKSERVVSGQRVIMRLIEDLKLSDGTVIPANTHVTGICEVGSRLDIRITTVSSGGRIFRTDMSAYDSDGTEGIYCPVIEKKKKKKAAGRVAGQAATSATSMAAMLFTGNPYIGSLANSTLNELTRTTLSDGSVAVNIVAGYDFYIFENVSKDGKKKNRG